MSQITWWIKYGIWGLPRNFRDYIVRFYQRGRYGWSLEDSWSVDYYLNSIIPPMLRRLQRGAGTPCGIWYKHFPEEGEEELSKEEHAKRSDAAEKEWHEIIGKIIYAFEMNNKFKDDCVDFTEEEQKKIKEGQDLFWEWYNALWD